MTPTPEEQAAMTAAWVNHIPTIMTESLSLTELAMFWNVNRNKAQVECTRQRE